MINTLMKLLQSINTELREQQQLNEVNPLTRAAGRVAGKFGTRGKEFQQKIQGQHTADKLTKQTRVDLANWAGQKGKKAAELSAKELSLFLQSKHMPVPSALTKVKDPSAPIGKNLIPILTQSALENPDRQAKKQARAGGEQVAQPQQTAKRGQKQPGQRSGQVTKQNFKATVDQIDKLLDQLKQAIPA